MTRVLHVPPAAAAHFAARRAGAQLLEAPARVGPPLSAEPPPGARDPLRVAYLVPRTDVGGGARILLEHARRLAARGHDVTTIADTPPPTWTQVGGGWQTVPPGVALASTVADADVVVAGYWEMLGAAALLSPCPVVHFEQGDFHLYERISPSVHAVVSRALRSTPLHMTVSGQTAGVMLERYGIPAAVLHNAVDRTVFRPDGPSAKGPGRRLLCVGSDANAFKGIDDVMVAWRAVRQHHDDVELTWVTPRPPVSAAPGVRVVVSPSQEQLACEYRSADAYVSGSRYESFPLPPLEAMACGTPVVSTANVGVLEYARDEVNALLTPVDDPVQLSVALRRLLGSSDLRSTLREHGLQTAAAFDWEAVVDRLEGLLRTAATRRPLPPGPATRQWRLDLSGARFDAAEGQRRLDALLSHTSAGAVAVPLRQTAVDGHDVVRWTVVARRRGAGAPTAPVRAWLPMTSDVPIADHPFQAAVDALRDERPSDAVAALRDAAPPAPRLEVTHACWLVIALLEEGRDHEAADVVQTALQQHPEHPDLYYLSVLVASLGGFAVDLEAARSAVALLQAGATSGQWFADPAALLDRVATSA